MTRRLSSKLYIENPSAVSSLPFWKAGSFQIPKNIVLIPETAFDPSAHYLRHEPYFKLVHRLQIIQPVTMPKGYELASLSTKEFAEHINRCFDTIGTSEEELEEYRTYSVYDESLWLGVRDIKSKKVVATAIGEFDATIGEGIIEWVEVSEKHRLKGLGHFLVNELLSRLKGKADFVTVSGRINNPSNPLSLYESCGFGERFIWHVIVK